MDIGKVKMGEAFRLDEMGNLAWGKNEFISELNNETIL